MIKNTLDLVVFAELPVQFLVPAVFLVLWVINQVFGRGQAKPPAPPRAPRPRTTNRPAFPTQSAPRSTTKQTNQKGRSRSAQPARDEERATTQPSRPARQRPSVAQTATPVLGTPITAEINELGPGIPPNRMPQPLTEVSQNLLDEPESVRNNVQDESITKIVSRLRSGDPQAIREMIILREILGPPVSRSGRLRGRRT